MTSNKQQRKASTFASTATYWLVLAALAVASLVSVVVVADAGTTLLGIAGMIAALVFVAAAISYGTTMRYRKRAPSR